MPPKSSTSRGRPRRATRVPAHRSAAQSPPTLNSSVPDQSPPMEDASPAAVTPTAASVSPIESSSLDTASPSLTASVPSSGKPLTSEPLDYSVLDAPVVAVEPPPNDVVSDSAPSQNPLGVGNPNSGSEGVGGSHGRGQELESAGVEASAKGVVSGGSSGKKKIVVKKTVKIIKKIVKKVPRRIVKGGPNSTIAVGIAPCTNSMSSCLNSGVNVLSRIENSGPDVALSTDIDKLQQKLDLCKQINENELNLEAQAHSEGVNVTSNIENSGPDVALSMDVDKLQQKVDLCKQINENELNLEVQAHNEGVNVTSYIENSGPDVPISVEIDKFNQNVDLSEQTNENEKHLELQGAQNKGAPMEVDKNVDGVECSKEERNEVSVEALDAERDGEKGTEELEVKEDPPIGALNEAENEDRNEEKRVDAVEDGDNVAKPDDEMGEGIYYSGEMEALERRKRRKREIFVGGLDNNAKEEDIRKVFEEVGEVLEVRLMMNGITGKNKGYAFLRYASAIDAKKALEKFSSVKICGKECGAVPMEGNDTIHLGGIARNWEDEDVAKLLQEIRIEGIDTILVMKDPQNKERNRGYAFVEFETCRDAQLAFKKLQKKDVLGKNSKMKVAWAGPLNEPNEAEMQKVKTVYAEYIPLTWDEEKVKENFEKFGEIDNVVLARNLRSAKRKDYAFINFKTREAAIACIESFKHQPQNDEGTKMNVKVSLARPISSSKQPKQVLKPINKEIPMVMPKPKQGNVTVRQFDPRNNAVNVPVRQFDPRNNAANVSVRQFDPRNNAANVTVRQIDPRYSAANVIVRQIDPRHTGVSSIHYDIHRPEIRHTVVHRDERSSTNSELVQLLIEEASRRPPHAGPLNVGHPTTVSGRKRPVSTLDPDPVYSDMSRYRLQTTLLERYGAHPQSGTSASSAYHLDLPYNGARIYLGSEPRDRSHGSNSLLRRY